MAEKAEDSHILCFCAQAEHLFLPNFFVLTFCRTDRDKLMRVKRYGTYVAYTERRIL